MEEENEAQQDTVVGAIRHYSDPREKHCQPHCELERFPERDHPTWKVHTAWKCMLCGTVYGSDNPGYSRLRKS